MTSLDHFDIEAIRKSANIATLKFLPVAESTNDSAIAWIREEAVPTPALVLTANQTRGRGQQDRSWSSAPGNLAATWILSGPGDAVQRGDWVGRLAIATALAVHDSIHSSLGDATNLLQIKWPNDIFIGAQKVSGILIETKPGTNCTWAMVGIGINVNTSVASLDKNLSASATSIGQHTNSEINLTELVIALSENLMHRVDLMATDDHDWETEYNSRLTSMNRQVVVKSKETEIRGTCRGIAANGSLRVETTDGIQLIASGSLILEP